MTADRPREIRLYNKGRKLCFTVPANREGEGQIYRTALKLLLRECPTKLPHHEMTRAIRRLRDVAVKSGSVAFVSECIKVRNEWLRRWRADSPLALALGEDS